MYGLVTIGLTFCVPLIVISQVKDYMPELFKGTNLSRK